MNLKIDPKAQALIFDIDGTLADTMPLHYQAWQEIARRHKYIYPSGRIIL